MSNDNRVSATLSAQDASDILAAVKTIRAKLPFLTSLSAQERRDLAKMGAKSVGFDEKCVAYMQSNPEFLPGFVPLEEIQKDRDLRTQMMRFAAELDSLTQHVDDTLMLVSSEVWMADLAFYQNVRAAARRDRPGAKVIFDDLQQRFPGGGSGGAAAVARRIDAPASQAV